MIIKGRIHDLSHLDPFTFEFVVPEKDGMPSQAYAIEVLFSWHCFTRGITAGEDHTGAPAYGHGRETRLFDERRYSFSKRLPGIIRDIGSRKCFHAGKGNFFTVEIIDEDGTRVEYAIFFKVSRRGKPTGLTLVVGPTLKTTGFRARDHGRRGPSASRSSPTTRQQEGRSSNRNERGPSA